MGVVNTMIEKYFKKKMLEYKENPTEGKLEELEYIQQERRIQNPFKFILNQKEAHI